MLSAVSVGFLSLDIGLVSVIRVIVGSPVAQASLPSLVGADLHDI